MYILYKEEKEKRAQERLDNAAAASSSAAASADAEAESSEDDMSFWNRRENLRLGDHLTEMEDEGAGDRLGTVREPAKEHRSRKNTEAGRAYLQRKRQKKREKRRAAKAHKRQGAPDAPQAATDDEENEEEAPAAEPPTGEIQKLQPQPSPWLYEGDEAGIAAGTASSADAVGSTDPVLRDEEPEELLNESDETLMSLGLCDDRTVVAPGEKEIDEVDDLVRNREGATYSELNVDRMVHWQDGVLIAKSSIRDWWSPAAERASSLGWGKEQPSMNEALSALAAFDVDKLLGLNHAQMMDRLDCDESSQLVSSPGRWFCFLHDTPVLRGLNKYYQDGLIESADWKMAYHGTALDNVPSILQRGLKQGPSATNGVLGIYVEGHHRLPCVLNYMTHQPIVGQDPLHWWAACTEVLVDRARGKTVHGQWVQPEETVFVVAVYLHCVNLLDTAEKGWKGWFRMHCGPLKALSEIREASELMKAAEYTRQPFWTM